MGRHPRLQGDATQHQVSVLVGQPHVALKALAALATAKRIYGSTHCHSRTN
ncbi:hypothetical protein PLUTE_a0638 [Pseudoalteromonas luteoviolacea DSM 6061]|nr:hypothetical protein [Pseudoalteromonas luteoviolacea DSM 6061]